jgi:hypothetical protein
MAKYKKRGKEGMKERCAVRHEELIPAFIESEKLKIEIFSASEYRFYEMTIVTI